MTTPNHDPVAIVGAACRLPGAPDVASFWRLLVEERDAIGPIPAERWDVEAFYDPVSGGPGRIPTRDGGFLEDIDLFDAGFFGMSPYEAMRIDPQQRLLLETAFDALADAGIPARSLAGQGAGVFTAVPFTGYWDRLRVAQMYDPHAVLATEPAGTAAGMLSYHLDLRGPSYGVQATCATALVAVHLACRALRSGETDLAIVAASTLQLSPDSYLSEAELLSPGGRCRFGDASADGFVKSEGSVVLILKPLSAALADGDQIYATLLGSAVANTGRSGGSLLGPGVDGQEALLRAAYRDAGVNPADVDYVEAHGTGTHVGDRTELTALNRVVGAGRPDHRRCLIGSVKSNIGHLEVSAGLAGLLKASLALRHRFIPRTLHVVERNPVLTEEGTAVELAERACSWPDRDDRPGIAGVSAFGLSGMNAHVVVAAPPPIGRPPHDRPRRSAYLLPISAREPAALRAQAGRFAEILAHPGGRLRDLCFSAGARRDHYECRTAVVGADRIALAEALRNFSEDAPSPSVVRSARQVTGRPRVVFVFPGQGSQWVGMGRQLLVENEVFADRMRECDAAIQAERGWSPIRYLRRNKHLRTVDVIQPMLWAMQTALAAVWQDWGITPDLVVGHSMGEIAAATVRGALTIPEAAAVVCRRSALLASMSERGAMWAVQMGERAARDAIGEYREQVCVGVVNSDRSTVLSGDAGALREVVEPLLAEGVFCRQVRVDYASHSPQMESLRGRLLRALGGVRPQPCEIAMFSTVRDRLVGGEELTADYWADNLRQPVRFGSAMCSVLMEERDTLFVEISPHPLLHSAIMDAAATCAAQATVIPSLLRDEPELRTLLKGLARAYVEGCEPRWDRLNEGAGYVTLPHYPWQRRRYWADSPTSAPRTRRPVADAAASTRATSNGTNAQREAAAPQAEARSVADLVDYMVYRVAETMALAPDDIDPDAPLRLHGVDSLFASRLQVRLAQDLGVDLGVHELLDTRSLSELASDLHGMRGRQEV